MTQIENVYKDDADYPLCILESPNGTKYKLKVDNDGILTTEEVV